MKVGGAYSGFNLSAKGLSVQRKKMDIIAENIANSETTRTESGQPYKRKFLKAEKIDNFVPTPLLPQNNTLKLLTIEKEHIMGANNLTPQQLNQGDINIEVLEDNSAGELIFMPNHPDADANGYVEYSNVNIINEMVEMIQATRSYEANLKALEASKQMIKDSLEI
jgi:flagellar basal-body rod protein FlgC